MIINIEKHIKNIIDSYNNLTGLTLIPKNTKIVSLKTYFDQVDFVLLSHGTEADPILNYGNQKALNLWEMSKAEFIQTPSRKTAEAPLQEERARLLQLVTSQGYINDYSGVRISKSGKRFQINQATVWNVCDENGQKIGQAATFQNWVFL
jgi:hypothetical protein